MNAQNVAKNSEPWRCNELQLRKLPLEISVPRRNQCVNALTGIKDPVTTLHTAREALKSVIRHWEQTGCNGTDLDQVRLALARLEGAE